MGSPFFLYKIILNNHITSTRAFSRHPGTLKFYSIYDNVLEVGIKKYGEYDDSPYDLV